MTEAALLTGVLEPTNLYGPGDNYHPENSHVIPALIRRFHEAKVKQAPKVTIWGTGTPMREFLYVDDMATASVFVMNLPNNLMPYVSQVVVGRLAAQANDVPTIKSTLQRLVQGYRPRCSAGGNKLATYYCPHKVDSGAAQIPSPSGIVSLPSYSSTPILN